MKVVKGMKGRLDHKIVGLVSLASLAVCAITLLPIPAAALSNGDTPAPTPVPAAPNVKFSPGIAEILKMLDAKVDTDVIKTYIKSSSIAYNPTASEIIALKERGVSNEILTAILEKGAQVRAQMATAGPMPSTAPYMYSQPQPQAPPYPYDYGMSSDYSDSGYPYGGYPYYAGYPYYNYWWYNYGYPWWGWPIIYTDGFGHVHHFHDFGHNHFVTPHQPFASRPYGNSFATRSTASFAPVRGPGGVTPGVNRGSPFGVTRPFGGFARSGMGGGRAVASGGGGHR